MKLEMMPIEAIREYENNPRDNDAAVESVAKSIKEFGFKVPVILDVDNVLIAGHTRVKAARLLGLVEVPAIRATDLTPEQVRSFRVADNKLHELSAWNFDLLRAELTELQALDVDLGLLGFDQDELSRIFDQGVKPGLTDPDEVPEPPDEAITQRGDLWILGDNRLLCGDSSSVEDVDRLVDGQPIHLVNTDPPYNVRVEPRSNNAIAAGLSSFGGHGLTHHQSFDLHRAQKRTASRYHEMDVATGAQSGKPTHKKLRPRDRPLANDFVSDEDFERMLQAWFGNISRVLAPGRGFYIWGGYANCGNYPPVLKQCGLYFSQAIIWVKEHPVLTRKDFMGNHEWCFYGWREGAAHVYLGPNNATDVWSVKKINPNAMVHLTQKPTELGIRAIQFSTRVGENVLDLFGGSGSTLIAAEQTGRKAFLMEIDPLYCDVIMERWQKFTGKKAERIPNTRSAELCAGVNNHE